MKIIGIILSLYVMALTAYPCNDVYSHEDNSVQIEFAEQNQNQTDDFDTCTPFCFCHCCQTLSFPTFFSITSINLAEITLDFKLKERAISSPVASIWQPPK